MPAKNVIASVLATLSVVSLGAAFNTYQALESPEFTRLEMFKLRYQLKSALSKREALLKEYQKTAYKQPDQFPVLNAQLEETVNVREQTTLICTTANTTSTLTLCYERLLFEKKGLDKSYHYDRVLFGQ